MPLPPAFTSEPAEPRALAEPTYIGPSSGCGAQSSSLHMHGVGLMPKLEIDRGGWGFGYGLDSGPPGFGLSDGLSGAMRSGVVGQPTQAPMMQPLSTILPYDSPHLAGGFGLGPDICGGDPWAAVLDSGDGEYIRVPVDTLRRLQAMGESQLQEIERLREEQAQRNQLQNDVWQLDQEVAEMEASCMIATNETQLRQQEHIRLDEELVRLQRQLQAVELKRDALVVEAEVLESWLHPASSVSKA